MLDELAASLVASQSTCAPVLRPSTAASLEAQAALADTRLPPRMVLLGLADAEAPGADGVDPYVVDAVVADTCSPPRMAALFADAEEPGADGVDPSVDIATMATDVEAPGVDGVDSSVVAAVGAEAPRADGVDAPVDAAVAAPDNIDAADLFFDSLRLPLQGLLHTPPRPRAARQEPASLVPRRSDRLAAKAAFRDPNPEKQAKRMLVNKWERRPDNAVNDTPNDTIAVKFHETFDGPVSPRKWEAMGELMPMLAKRWNVASEVTP